MIRLVVATALGVSLLLMPATARAQTVAELQLGSSGQGRPITAIRVGDGPRKLVIVGDTHGFPEANTYALATQLAAHFRANPGEVPPAVRLYIIPTLNPDGLALGTRFNARGVDLNRNMNTNFDTCPENDWRPTVFGAYGLIADTGGPYADSEVESRLIRTFLLDASAAIFLHSAAGNVFPAECAHAPSIALAQAYAAGAGYRYARRWEAYQITGGMHDWAGSLGIAAIIPELLTGELPEFAQNLSGVRAVLASAAELVPAVEDVLVDGQPIPAPIWRYWRMHGGSARFGPLLAAPERQGPLVRVRSANALLLYDARLADTPGVVQAAPFAAPIPALAAPAEEPAAFAAFYAREDGPTILGLPLGSAYHARDASGLLRILRVYERGVLAYDPASDTVYPEPIVWQETLRTAAAAPTRAAQLR